MMCYQLYWGTVYINPSMLKNWRKFYDLWSRRKRCHCRIWINFGRLRYVCLVEVCDCGDHFVFCKCWETMFKEYIEHIILQVWIESLRTVVEFEHINTLLSVLWLFCGNGYRTMTVLVIVTDKITVWKSRFGWLAT